jgi:hypothetical protein
MEPEVPGSDAQRHREGTHGSSAVVHAAQLHENEASTCLISRGISEIAGKGAHGRLEWSIAVTIAGGIFTGVEYSSHGFDSDSP